MSDEREPQGLLDAIADDPDALGPWRVLADWLLEREVPHGILAAYELKLETGTNDPDLLGTYAEQRAIRMQPPPEAGLGWGDATWRCGYITRLVLLLARYGDVDWDAFFGAPALRALSWLQLTVRGASFERAMVAPHVLGALERRNAVDKRATLEAVLRCAPPTLRRISVFAEGPLGLETGALEPLLARRPGVQRLDLALGEVPVEPLTSLCAAGYPLVNLDGTKLDLGLATRLVEVARGRLVLGGTGLSGREALAVDRPEVSWCAPDVKAALVAENGRLFPLSNNASARFHHPSLHARTIQPSPWGWQVMVKKDARGLELDAIDLEDGGKAALDRGDGRVFIGGDLDARYREALKAFAPDRT